MAMPPEDLKNAPAPAPPDQAPLKIAVMIKQVPDFLEAKTDGRSGLVIRSGGDLNLHDGPALELALRLKEKRGAKVDLYSMGPPSAAGTVRKALRLGADRGFHIQDPLLAGSDTFVTASVLAAALRLHGPYDLITLGLSTSDGGTGQVGPELACLLNVPSRAGCALTHLS